MSALSNIRVDYETEKTLAFGSIVAGYTLVGTRFANNIRLLVLQNLTDQAVTFSFDGIRDAITLPASGQIVLDWGADKSRQAADFIQAINSGVWVKQSGVPTTGSVYVSAFFAAGPN